MTTHLVTGVTGFVGSALALELLSDPEVELVCAARAKRPAESATERVQRKLRRAADVYARGDVANGIEQRVSVLELDLADSRAEPRDLPSLDEAWHVAASLKYGDGDREELHAHNVEGTRRMLDAAHAAGARVFNYVSTAYVAGRSSGSLLEAPIADDRSVNNAYERSKIHAERVVGAETRLQTRILRPSVVVGDSGTHAALSHAGLYGFVRGLLRLRSDVKERMGDLLSVRPLRLAAHPDATLNLVPIDTVVRAAVGISRANGSHGIYHLVNTEPPPIVEIGDAVFPLLGLRPPRLVDDEDEFTAIDRTFNDDPRTRFFRDYISAERAFDTSNVSEVLGADVLRAPLSGEDLRAYCTWYLGVLGDRVGTQPGRLARTW